MPVHVVDEGQMQSAYQMFPTGRTHLAPAVAEYEGTAPAVAVHDRSPCGRSVAGGNGRRTSGSPFLRWCWQLR